MTDNTPIEIETSQTLDTMLHQILNLALVEIKAYAGSLMLVANRQKILQIKARLGKPRPRRKKERIFQIDNTSIAGHVVLSKQSYNCGDIKKDPYFSVGHSGINFKSLLSVPVIFKDKVIAVINADSPKKNFFTMDREAKLEQIANQVASSIAERMSVVEALAEVGVEMLRLPGTEGEVNEVLVKIVEYAQKSLGADIVTLYPYDMANDDFPVEKTGPIIYPSVRDPSPMHKKVFHDDVPYRVVHDRKSGFYPDVKKELFLSQPIERTDIPRDRFIVRESIASVAALVLPFRAATQPKEEVVGVMFVNYRTPHDFNIDERAALATFADYAAIAILNARQEQARRTEQLNLAESILKNLTHRLGNLAASGFDANILRNLIKKEAMSVADKETANRTIDRIIREATSLNKLVERIGKSIDDSGNIINLRYINIKEILIDVVDQVKKDFPTLNITHDLQPELPAGLSVDYQIHQVLRDIINNAYEAMHSEESQELSIKVYVVGDKTRQIYIEISDNGSGISAEIRPQLFNLGASNKKEKIGMGLWWSRTFIRSTGGDILLDDAQREKGSRFIIKIPCRPIDQPDTDLPEKDILIVDDSVEWRGRLMDLITSDTSLTYQIECVADYTSAKEVLRNYHFKLAVVDIQLVDGDPENKDGLRLITDMAKENLDSWVIIISNYGTKENELTAERNPKFIKIFDKRYLNFEEFQNTVRHLMQVPIP